MSDRRAFVGLFLASACSAFNPFPEVAPERGLEACANADDDDFDGELDCEDDDCIGFCPEETELECSNGVDDDGDGQLDARDARCWSFASISAEPCLFSPAFALEENFEDAELTPELEIHGEVLPGSVLGAFILPEELDSVLLGADPRTLEPASLSTARTFRARWEGLELRVRFQPLLHIPQPTLFVGLAPQDRPNALSELLAVSVTGPKSDPFNEATIGPGATSVTVLEATIEGPPITSRAWFELVISVRDGEIAASIDGSELARVRAERDLSSLGPFRVVFAGAGTAIEELSIRIPEQKSCGSPPPQIVPPNGSHGADRIALAKSDAGVYCAITLGCLEGDDGEDPDAPLRPVLMAWRSTDGAQWTRVAPPGAGDIAAELGAAGIAWNASSSSFEIAAVRAAPGAITIELAGGPDCGSWSRLGAKPAVMTPVATELAFDACRGQDVAPSYVIRARGPGEAPMHEIYLPLETGEVVLDADGKVQRRLALQRLTSADGVSFALDPERVLDLDASIERSIQVVPVGPRDLALIAAVRQGGLRIMTALDAAGRDVVRVDPDPLVAPSGSPGAFDARAIISAGMAIAEGEGVILYGARLDDGDSHAGTARFFARPRIKPITGNRTSR